VIPGFVRAAAVASAAAPEVVPDVALPPPGGDWMARAEAIARAVAGSLKAKANLAADEWARLPCFVGSSSHFVGALEQQAEPAFEPPIGFATRLARCFGSEGPVLSVDTACTSGITALGLARDRLEAGTCRHALVLGVELANRLSSAGFAGLGLLSAHAARPCDRERDGLVLGEAFAALLLSTSGPWRIAALSTEIDPSGLAAPAPNEEVIGRAMRAALSAAGWRAHDIDLLKLQSGGSPVGDLAEARAIHAIFPAPPALVSLKGAIGHTLGASGPAELALLLSALSRGRVPATQGFRHRDDELGLAPAGGDGSAVRRVLFNLAGFGGTVAALALERA
jgi:3-oxoacyl-[acyl-carrier-protein] synthase I